MKYFYVKTALQGFLIGSADVVPGVSGGTMALILGIYSRLIKAILGVNKETLTLFLTLRWKKALELTDYRFILPLLFGLGAAVLLMSKLLKFLLAEYPIYTWSVFFGFVLSSALTLFVFIENKKARDFLALALGAAFGFFISGLVPGQTEISLPYIFLSGFIAICAMILPGISGSAILVLLGSYSTVLGFIANPFELANLTGLAVFAAGALPGLLGFARVLNFALAQWPQLILAMMTGIMLGSLRKIWPWKESTVNLSDQNESLVSFINVLPAELNFETLISLALIIVSLILGHFLAKKKAF